MIDHDKTPRVYKTAAECLVFALVMLAVFAAILATAGVLRADHFYNGYTTPAGYVYHGGYWYYGQQAYTRSQVYSPGYWSYGVYYPGYYYYQYTPYYPPTTPPAAPAVTAKDPGWRSKLLDIAAERDKIEGKIRQGQFEQQWFLEGVKALKLEGNFGWQDYGHAPPYGAGYGSLQLGYHGTQGSTVYGYEKQTVSNLYNQPDPNQLYQQAGRLADTQQKYAADATKSVLEMTDKVGSNAARVAEIMARADAAAKLLKAAEGPPSSETKTVERTFRVEQSSQSRGGAGPVDPMTVPGDGGPTVVDAPALTRDQLIAQDCKACHNPGTKRGGLDLTDWAAVTPAQKLACVSRLTTTNDGERMPRTKDGHAGRRYTRAEVLEFLK